ncbi:hypothetical protein HYT24_00170 [Candidatus Pacearchaeota archaeon]|nr:hypothetical protein [Candidatus Pacearchaeota archaeon]
MREIFKISKDLIRAKDLYKTAKDRLYEIIPLFPKDKSYKIIEEYYEIMVQLITSIMYSDGYKTLSHTGLIQYLATNYTEFSRNELNTIDILRKLRHGIVYYGKQAEKEFLLNHEDSVKELIDKLIKIIEFKIK